MAKINTQTVKITSEGIRKLLKKHSFERCISEYIWNGFDAKASVVKIKYEIEDDNLQSIRSLSIEDNGIGINYDELESKFKPVLVSQKQSTRNDLVKGKNGFGRFSFDKFAQHAKWETTFEKDNQNYAYIIDIDSANLIGYKTNDVLQTDSSSGTTVTFSNLDSKVSVPFIEDNLRQYLITEFSWYLEVRRDFKIFINDSELDVSGFIADQEDFSINIKHQDENIVIPCKYRRWNKKPNDEFSRFYFLNDNLDYKTSKTTLLNNKGDGFWHSVIVIHNFFDNVQVVGDEDDIELFASPDQKKTFKEIVNQLNAYLKNKRKPFLKKNAEKLVEKYENESVFPDFGNESWNQMRKTELQTFVKELYEVEPRVFTNLNKEQRCIFIRLLNLLMEENERDRILKIISSVIELTPEDQEHFTKILEKTQLSSVIATLKLLTDRFQTIENLKDIVFKHEWKAGEKDHLQAFIENHYWIFGEEFNLVCAEEVKFEEALRSYRYILLGEDEKEVINHPDKYKEMDLFLTGKDFRNNGPENLVVEIKNPTNIKKLTNKEYGQIETYIDVILKKDRFNDHNEKWNFMLIGQDYDDIVGRKITDKNTGLCMEGDNYKLYVKKWSEIINDVEKRLNFIQEKLQLKRDQLSSAQSIDDVMTEMQNSSAKMEN